MTTEIQLNDDGPIPVSDTYAQTRRLLAYLLRGTRMRISRDRIGERRYKGLSGEIADALTPLVVSERSVLGFYRAFCARFGVDATGGDSEFGPVHAWLPERGQPHGVRRVRWDRAVAALDYKRVRLVIQENPSLFASFACSKPAKPDEEIELVEAEEAMFAALPEPVVGGRAVATLPRQMIAPRSFRTVWTCTAPLSHGADEKHGNVNLFRRERRIDALTGEHGYVPFMSGNAVRGMWRDLIMARYCELLGVNPQDVPPARVHALFAGGSIESGADTAKVDTSVRRSVRRLCPPYDLLGGCIDQQIMGGRVRVHDAVIVCRENAWLVREAIAPGKDPYELAASLPEAAELTTLRLLTRQAHKEYDGADGSQMLVNTEIVVSGSQFVHSFQVFGIEGVNPITLACFADLLSSFGGYSTVGAGNARGYGLIAFDPYQPGPNVPALPDPKLYTDFIAEHRDECRAWLLATAKSDDAPKAKGKKGKADDVALAG